MIYLVYLLGIATGIVLSSIINAVRAGNQALDTMNTWKELLKVNYERNLRLKEIEIHLRNLEKGEP